MFLSILNWMYGHTPGFMRPAVGWLIDGLRSITNYISQRWASLGRVVGHWWAHAWYWWMATYTFAQTVGEFARWLVLERIPRYVASIVDWAIRFLQGVIAGVRDLAIALVAQVKTWVTSVVDWLAARLAELYAWANSWIERLRVTLATLIGALAHVLGGPVVLAEWLAGAMWAAFLRLLYAQRDRVFTWLLRESRAFSVWLAREIEDVIVRFL